MRHVRGGYQDKMNELDAVIAQLERSAQEATAGASTNGGVGTEAAIAAAASAAAVTLAPAERRHKRRRHEAIPDTLGAGV